VFADRGVGSGDEMGSFDLLLPARDRRQRPSERIRARGESRPFPTRSPTLVLSRKSGVLLFSPRDSMGRRRHAPSKLIDRLWRARGSFVLLNDGDIHLLSKNGTSITGSSFGTTLDGGVRCRDRDDGEGRHHVFGADQVRGMGDEAEDGKATVEIPVGI
jgi:hypothetical protein